MVREQTKAGWRRMISSPVFLTGLLVFLFFSFLFVGRALWWPVRIGMVVIAVVLVVKAVRYATRKPRYFVFALVIVAINWGFLELACVVFDRAYLANHPVYGRGRLWEMSPEIRSRIESFARDETRYYGFDAELGWTIMPNGDSQFYRANAMAIRGDREYELEKRPGTTRVVCAGDSYTHCAEVENGDTWEARAEGLGEYEFINLGVSGYGLTQAYLRYGRLGVPFETDYVFIGFMTNNIQRTINAFRPFVNPTSGIACTKPYAALDEEGKLVIRPNPFQDRSDYEALLSEPDRVLEDLGELDYYVRERRKNEPRLPSGRVYRFLDQEFGAGDYLRKVCGLHRASKSVMPELNEDYEIGSYPLEAVTQLFDRFVSDVEGTGARPVILIFPNKEDIKRYNEGKAKAHENLLAHFRGRGQEYIDVLDILAERYGEKIPRDDLFVVSHYNAETNQLLAERLVEYVGDREPAGRGE
jgi:hypothetical protein